MTRRLVALLGGLAVGVLVGGWPGVAVGLGTAVVLARYLARLEPAQVRRERERAELDLERDWINNDNVMDGDDAELVAAIYQARWIPDDSAVYECIDLQLASVPTLESLCACNSCCRNWSVSDGVPFARTSSPIIRGSLPTLAVSRAGRPRVKFPAAQACARVRDWALGRADRSRAAREPARRGPGSRAREGVLLEGL